MRQARDDRTADMYYVGVVPITWPQLERFNRVPSGFGFRFGTQLATATVFAILFLIPLGLYSASGIPWRSWLAVIPLVGGIALSIWPTLAVSRWLSIAGRTHQGSQDFETFGAPAASERYVGIAYSDGIWSYRDDVAWDRGCLDLRDTEIRFRGFATEFGLALSQIEDVRIVYARRLFGRTPFVSIEWRDDEQKGNFMLLEVRDPLWPKEALEATKKLAGDLRDLVERNAASSKAKYHEMPFKSSNLEFCANGQTRVTHGDRLVAFAWSAIFFTVLFIAANAIERQWKLKIPGVGGFLGVMACLSFQSVVYKRFVKRLQDTGIAPSQRDLA